MKSKKFSQGSRGKISVGRKLIYSLIATLFFFLGLESILALLGVSKGTESRDPFVGFSNFIPLFERTTDRHGNPIARTASNKLVWFNDQSFPVSKDKKTRRVFCLGGSTTYGHPYWDSTSFSRWLREFLPLVDPQHEWEVINAGGISYASYRVANLMEELAEYQPDLFIVYSVHNEFLERRTYSHLFNQSTWDVQFRSVLAQTRTWSVVDRTLGALRVVPDSRPSEQSPEVLPAEVDEILNHTIGPVDYHRDDGWRENVLRHYESNLNRMVSIANRCGAKIVLINSASNEKDCSPFKSQVLTPSVQEPSSRFLDTWGNAFQEREANRLEEALSLYRQALSIEPQYAHLHYEMGQTLYRLKRFDEAYRAFESALDQDVCPLRAVPEINNAIRRVGKSHDVTVVDFERRLRQLCNQQQGHSLFGNEYFMDHVHPTVDVHRRLSEWIIEDLLQDGWLKEKELSDESHQAAKDQIVRKVMSEIDIQAQGIALRNLAKVIHWSGKFAEAEPLARDAIEMLGDDAESRFVLADSLKNLGRPREAIRQYERLFDLKKDYGRAFLPFGALLANEGELVAAKAYLLAAALREPNDAHVQHLLGRVHFKLGEFRFALDSLEQAHRSLPDDPSVCFELAMARRALQDEEGAISLLQKLIDQGIKDKRIEQELQQMLELKRDPMHGLIQVE